MKARPRCESLGRHRRAPVRRTTLTVAAIIFSSLFLAESVHGQTYTVLHSFGASGAEGQGSYISGGLLLSSTGNLYGTASQGGDSASDGTIFRLSLTGKLSVLHRFDAADGSQPSASLIRDSTGAFYGTTVFGGGNTGCGDSTGCGTVFKLYQGTLTVLHAFGGPDGAYVAGGLVHDSAGNLYGTTRYGGAFNDGAIFKIDSAGTFTLLYSFSEDGQSPWACNLLLHDSSLYGTTYRSGKAAGRGTIFKLNLTTGKYAVLHSFSGADGENPTAGLVRDSAGNLYGTTYNGGASHKGVIFELTNGTLTVLHSFSGADGQNPYAGLVRDSAGNLYGTTVGGGEHKYGTVFKLDTNGTLTLLHQFDSVDGVIPEAGLILDSAGNLYGTTTGGGAFGGGTVFEFSP